jgi:hypothetical protein
MQGRLPQPVVAAVPFVFILPGRRYKAVTV